MNTKQPKYNTGDILSSNGQLALVKENCGEVEMNCSFIEVYQLEFFAPDGKTRIAYVEPEFVEKFFKPATMVNGQPLPADGWNKTAVTPMQVGWVVKRWNKPTGPVVWAGYYNGSAKLASCDEWLALSL